jgi:uncharacterized protein YcfL
MRYLLIVIISTFLISACSSSRELELTSLNQQPCRNEVTLNNPNEFIGETAENFSVYQQGDQVFASVDVRTYCNARISFDLERNSDQILLKLRNNNTMTDKCVCVSNITTSIKNLEAGSYNFMVTDATGSTMLAKQTLNVNR